MTPNRETIRFNVLRNALYHTARRRSLERVNRVFNFLVVILGTAAASSLGENLQVPTFATGMAVAILGALQLVYDFGRQARDHQTLQRDYYSLLADIESKIEPDENQCAEWWSKMIRITGDEPPVLRALDAKAYNDAIGATGAFDMSERLRIPLWHRLVGGFFAFEGYHYKKVSEDQEPS
ncbi:MAG: hypothetical protein FJX25_00405 [Alphaproteobacteria bacterium]|nr:hypothetical protein [Alphaproteobacteria bacterium]